MGKGSRGVDSRALECGWVVVVEVGRGDKVGGVEGLLVMVVGMVHRVEAGRVAQGGGGGGWTWLLVPEYSELTKCS